MDTEKFIVNIKAKYIVSDSAQDIDTRFDSSNYELARPIPREKKLKSYQINGR